MGKRRDVSMGDIKPERQPEIRKLLAEQRAAADRQRLANKNVSKPKLFRGNRRGR